jgi:hypothetical protein
MATPLAHTKAAPTAMQVLVGCIEAEFERPERLCTSVNGFESWAKLKEVALREGMAPLLYRALSSHCPDTVPASVLDELRTLYRANAQRVLRMSAVLLRVLDLLAEQGIVALPFKGPLLTELVFGDTALRQIADLDLLLPEGEVAGARQVLLGAGFNDGDTGPLNWRLTRADCELGLVHSDSGVLVELHWRTGPRFARASFAAEALLLRAQSAPLLGRSVKSLCHEDVFFVMCTHGCTHEWERLEGLATLAAFVRQKRDWEWESVLERARERHCLYRCLTSLALLATHTGLDRLPTGLRNALLAHPRALRLAAELKIADEKPQRATVSGVLRSISWQARCLDTSGETAIHLGSRILTPGSRDWRWVSLPPRLSGLYYVVRPLRVTWRSMRTVVDLARRGRGRA